MKRDELIGALRRLRVETGSLACLGCGHEHNCGTQGCAILRAAVEELEKKPALKPGKNFATHIETVRGLLRSALEMTRWEPEEPAWRQYKSALAAALGAMEHYYRECREEDGNGT